MKLGGGSKTVKRNVVITAQQPLSKTAPKTIPNKAGDVSSGFQVTFGVKSGIARPPQKPAKKSRKGMY